MQRNWKKLDKAVDFVQATSKTVKDKIPTLDDALGKVGLMRANKGRVSKPYVDNVTDATFTDIPNDLLNKIKAAKNSEEIDIIAENHS